MTRISRHPRREARKASAIECAEARSKRSNEEQLARLDVVLGIGKGATKERARLQKAIAEAAKPKVKAKAEKQEEEAPQVVEAVAEEKPKRKSAKNSKAPAKKRSAKAD